MKPTLFKTDWLNAIAPNLILKCNKKKVFGDRNIIECLQLLERITINLKGDYDDSKDYVGPEGWLTKIIPRMWWNKAAWIHDGGYKYLEGYVHYSWITIDVLNEVFNIMNGLNTPPGKSKVLNSIAGWVVGTFGHFFVKTPKYCVYCKYGDGQNERYVTCSRTGSTVSATNTCRKYKRG